MHTVHTDRWTVDETQIARKLTNLNPSQTSLLVSVRDGDEAELAVAAGVAIIDFKEPNRGALAPVDRSIWWAAADRFDQQCFSAALGESDTGPAIAREVPPAFRFAKIGPSGHDSIAKLRQLWDRVDLPSSVELVPVAYADFQFAQTVSPEDVLRTVIASGRHRLLIDTFGKDGRGTLDHSTLGQLATIARTAAEHGVWLAIAGSIRRGDVDRLAAAGIRPDCFGVRGDVCKTAATGLQRNGSIDARKITAWQTSIGGLRVLG